METDTIVYLLLGIACLVGWLYEKHRHVLKWIGAFIGFIALGIFGQAFIPPIAGYAILFLVAVYFVVYQAVRDARQ